ncbi:two-component sensor histidine kinase [Mycoavidus sp. B2-EB]|nr:ATP-binding protein [Mycoavidus sp. B2-EB]BBO59854.1 two-component sensor histidine kinase [Mycoavidus sp. B2-EB]
MNLLENAAKYTPRGTRLEMSAISIVEHGQSMVRVMLDDQGLGLPPGMETHLFEKFTRGEKESTQPGVGLGLAICRSIVEAHQGKVGAENLYKTKDSTQPSGARFWFTLPLEISDSVAEEIGLSSDTADAAKWQGAR